MVDRKTMIQARLEHALAPSYLKIADQSDKHIGHAGAKNGGGHFAIQIASCKFEGITLIARHKMVYHALSELMKKEIHALSIQAITPNELDQQKK